MPEHTFDVHVLRTFKRNLIAVLDQLQASLPRPNEAIRQVIFMLNQAFQEVELLYLVWRHDRVQNTLQHGISAFRIIRGSYLTHLQGSSTPGHASWQPFGAAITEEIQLRSRGSSPSSNPRRTSRPNLPTIP